MYRPHSQGDQDASEARKNCRGGETAKPKPQENIQTVCAAVREEQVGSVLHRRIVIDQVVQIDSSEISKDTTL